MKKVIIAGAGQMGRAVSELLNPNEVEFLGFADNDSSKWTQEEGRCPVFSMETAIRLEPDEIIISTMGDDRARQINEQLRVCRFYGNVTFLKDMYVDFDIRSRCIRNLANRIKAGVSGDIAELGVYKGNTAWQLNRAFPDRKLYLFDTFEGFDDRDADAAGRRENFSDTSAEGVLSRMPYPENCIVKKGYFPDTAEGLENLRFAMVSLDPDLYEPTLAGLEYFWPRMNEGGAIIVHDYDNRQFDGVRRAVAEFERRLNNASCSSELQEDGSHGVTGSGGITSLKLVPLGDLHGSCVIIK